MCRFTREEDKTVVWLIVCDIAHANGPGEGSPRLSSWDRWRACVTIHLRYVL